MKLDVDADSHLLLSQQYTLLREWRMKHSQAIAKGCGVLFLDPASSATPHSRRQRRTGRKEFGLLAREAWWEVVTMEHEVSDYPLYEPIMKHIWGKPCIMRAKTGRR